MSKISQELRALMYINNHHGRTTLVNTKELADYLEVSERQARRYMDDLLLTNQFHLQVEQGRYGGYWLDKPLPEGFGVPENISLTLALAMRRNEHIEKVLGEVCNYVACEAIEGENYLSDELVSTLEVLIKAIEKQKEVNINYEDKSGYRNIYYVQPYKIYLTNKSYYLLAVHKDTLKKYDLRGIYEVTLLGAFRPEKKYIEEVKKMTSGYGIKNDNKPTTLRVKCHSKQTLLDFDKYFEHKGEINMQELTYVVSSSSENELFYPLFRISTKQYDFLDEEFKESYLRYLKNVIKSIGGK